MAFVTNMRYVHKQGVAAGLYALGFSLSRGICGHSQEDCSLSEVMMLMIYNYI